MSTIQRIKLNILDCAVAGIVVLCLLGFGLARAGYAGVDKVIQGTSKVQIDVYITGLKTRDTQLFKVGETSSITIRNQPVHPPMVITKVERSPKQVAFLSLDGKKALAFADPANPIAHDFLVSVQDEAERTQDGFVVRGNKIKVGNQIELESFKYRVQGVVVDIKAVP
ncbi:MAG TPA: DUF4330 domain-containing protein [Candidatus Obscuribacterales bacterium]